MRRRPTSGRKELELEALAEPELAKSSLSERMRGWDLVPAEDEKEAEEDEDEEGLSRRFSRDCIYSGVRCDGSVTTGPVRDRGSS